MVVKNAAEEWPDVAESISCIAGGSRIWQDTPALYAIPNKTPVLE